MELKPCPFCGSEKVFLNVIPPHTHIFANMPISLGSATVECLSCEAALIRDTEEEVVKAWNRRATPMYRFSRWYGTKYNYENHTADIVAYDPESHEELANLFCQECGRHALLNGKEEDVTSNYCPYCGAEMVNAKRKCKRDGL